MSDTTQKSPNADYLYLKYFFIALSLINLIAGLLIWPEHVLNSEFSYFIFLPIVMVSALYAGFYAGLIVTSLICVGMLLLCPLLVDTAFLENSISSVNITIFALICSLLSYYLERTYCSNNTPQSIPYPVGNSNTDHKLIHSIIESSPNMMGYWDKNLRCHYANHAFSQWFDIPPKDIIGIHFLELVGEQLFALNKPYIDGVLQGESQRFERILNKTDGSIGHIIGHYIPDFDIDGTVKGFAIQANEVTVLKETEAKTKLAACVFDNTLDGVMITDVAGTILSVNPSFTNITGYTQNEAIGQTPRILQSNQYDQGFYNAMWQEIATEGRWNGDIWNRRKDGQTYLQRMNITMVKDENNKPIHYVAVFSDITSLWRKDERIKHLAFHDALTNLPNRTLLMERLEKILSNTTINEPNIALMFLDLDGFKFVNDKFGHNTGDNLLKEVARRLSLLTQKSDTVARVGGDEFIFILSNPQGKKYVTEIATQILYSINQPINILDDECQIGVSIGIAMSPENGSTPEALIRMADDAMYIAKSSKQNKIIFSSVDGQQSFNTV
ncbi:diguanylate cyclase domain-containing protein [Vibrio rumoiensis]|uniref:Diguanylate cyclase n=1 Tax=Vibrio rumoiensis 1S-45 TaxID=1188252 RepID=A0A1E5E391_9VIBR|nr:diguanylate cyclase [Vibrio rumoiensis]OEF25783.1 diguanylate cyclase [Vibrio rumoiensis 1S-45]